MQHRRNPSFTGREDLLKELHDALQSSGPAAITQSITGLGGVGKTQTAVEYAYRYREEYDLIWWVRAEEEATLHTDFAGLGGALELGMPANTPPDQVRAAVLSALGSPVRRLLILDNAVDPASIRPNLPNGGRCHVLITSRHQAWGNTAHAVRMPVWKEPQAAEFLKKRLGTPPDANSMKELTELLGGLPLAFEQAAAYMEATGKTLPAYVELFRKHQLTLFKEPVTGKPDAYHSTVATVWEMALKEIEAVPLAAQLLNLCAYFSPDDIPFFLLRTWEPAKDEIAFDQSIAALKRYSLIEVTEDAISIHRLVQAVVRERQSEDEQKEWAEVAIGLFPNLLPFEVDTAPGVWPVYSRLQTHALMSADYAAMQDVGAEAASHVFNKIGLYLKIIADFQGARNALERALRISETAYGPGHPTIAIYVNNLGSILRALGNLSGAQKAFERALKIDEKSYGPDHPNVAIGVNNLGMILQALGDLPGAQKALERALKIGEVAFGNEHPQVAIYANNLGSILHDLGDLPGAQKAYERALKIGEAAYGKAHPRVAIYASNLGSVLRARGDLQGTRNAFERALEIDEAAYGANHPDVAIDVNNLGSVLRDLGDLPGAQKAAERALSIFRQFLGDQHPNTQKALKNLNTLLQEMGQPPMEL